MALTISKIGSNNSITSDTSLSVTTTAAAAVGDWLVVFISSSNAKYGGSTSPVSSIADSDGVNTYTQRSSVVYDPSGASAGAALDIYTAELTDALSIGATVDITFSVDTSQKAAIVFLVKPGGGETVEFDSVDASGSADSTTTHSAPTVSVTSGYTIFGAASIESDDVVTGDSDTDQGSWSAAQYELADAGSDAVSMEIVVQYKTVSGTANQSWACTTSNARDSARNYIILYPAAGSASGSPMNYYAQM